jgi:hypothetical protein
MASSGEPSLFFGGQGWFAPAHRAPKPPRAHKPAKPSKKSEFPPIPSGPLHIIVSIDRQRVTLFANGTPFAGSKISTGTASHPTPMGVFSVIQKNRHHVSNLYGAKMPYMQRLTWSGTAMHEGPLPGRPASHGCIRLPQEFAEMLWKATRIGARVIITRDEVAPVEIEHPALFAGKQNSDDAPQAAIPPDARAEARLVRTADGANRVPGAAVQDASKPLVTKPSASMMSAEQPTKVSIDPDRPVIARKPGAAIAADKPLTAAAEPAAEETPRSAAEPAPAVVDQRAQQDAVKAALLRKRGPVSVFVSRQEARLYVRHAMEPLFDMPVTIADPDRPLGTHVYTAMMPADEGLRWTAVSIPSAFPRAAAKADGKKKGGRKAAKPAVVEAGPPSDAKDALDRIAMPPEVVERIALLVTPGSSLIVSDNKLSGETGKSTGFIVETR